MKETTTLLSQERCKQILQVSYERFLHYGINKTTMRDIAADLDMSVGNLYLYFDNKRAIVLAIAQQCREKQEGDTREIVSNPEFSPSEKLERLMLAKLDLLNSYRLADDYSKDLIAYLLQEFPERRLEWQRLLEASIAGILEEGVQQGSFQMEDVGLQARMLRVATAHFFLPPHVPLPEVPCREELVALIRWLLAFIERRNAPCATR